MRELLPFLGLYRQQWRRLFLGALLVVATLAASVGLLSVSGWFISATAVAGLVITRSADFNYLMPAGAVRGLSVVRTASRWAERVVTHDATFRLLATLRCWFFEKLGRLAGYQLSGIRHGDLLNRMVADVDALDHVYLRLITPIIGAVMTTIGTSVLVGIFAPQAGLLLAAVLASLTILLPFIFYRLGNAPSKTIASESMQLRQHLLDYFVGSNELRIFAAVQQQFATIKQHQQRLYLAQQRMADLAGFAQGAVTCLNGWALVMVLICGYEVMHTAGDVGPLLALLGFATMASFEAIAPLAGAFQHLGHTKVAARRLNKVIHHPQKQGFGNQSVSTFSKLKLESLAFKYPLAQQPLFERLTIEVAAGEKVAIVGQTGCGKSTLLQLLSRDLEPTDGAIMVDEINLTQLSETGLRQLFCVVSQRIHIFNDTLANNLRISSNDASDSQLVQVLHDVQLAHLIDNNLREGNGLDQWLGDGGRALSGGERRRIGIARALLSSAPIVLLDEPTEGLDDATEEAVINILMDKLQQRTMLYVTHKPAALASMDRVIKLENGIVEHL